MRIISQLKTIDIPYETNQFHIQKYQYNEKSEAYILWDILTPITNISLGIYSTFEKALKVMEMIREAHVGKSQKILVTEEEGKIEEVINMNYYFYMPKDEDVK